MLNRVLNSLVSDAKPERHAPVQDQTAEGQAVLVKSEPVTISGAFKSRSQACAERNPSGQAETVTS